MTLLEIAQPSFLQILWFLLIAVLWIGFFVLEGFDFGVGMLYQVLSRKQPEERRVMVNSIGPTWDANEVWLLTAGGATFAAFPGWYGTLFSGLYLPLFLVLLGLIIRGISFEYRALHPETAWKNTFDWANSIGSFIVVLVFGVGFANFVMGMPVDGNHLFTGSVDAAAGTYPFVSRFFGLFMPFALLGGVMLVSLFLSHGAQWLCLKTEGIVEKKARNFSSKAIWVTIVLVLAFEVWGNLFYATDNPYIEGWGPIARWITSAVAVLALVFAGLMGRSKRDGLAFIGTAVAVAMVFANIFVAMYGTLGFISMDANNPLNIVTASSSAMTLGLMRTFAFIMVPVVLLYTVWAYSVFRKRLSVENLPAEDHAKEPATV